MDFEGSLSNGEKNGEKKVRCDFWQVKIPSHSEKFMTIVFLSSKLDWG
jgi:hypothetical protein